MKNDTFFKEPAVPIKQPREQRYTTLKAMGDLRRKWFSQFSGNLSTLCRKGHPLEGYPVGSIVPYTLDDENCPVILMANIAEHTQNALENPKASLFIHERSGGDVQTAWRICAIGDLIEVPDNEFELLSERYYRAYPKARAYGATHSFKFFRLIPKKFRIIMGFGDIRWIAADAPFDRKAFAADDVMHMIEHMNNDHQDAMRKYLKQLGTETEETLEMVHINPWGAVIREGDDVQHFIAFPEPCDTPEAVRAALVQLAKA